jgi:hypothetical protein
MFVETMKARRSEDSDRPRRYGVATTKQLRSVPRRYVPDMPYHFVGTAVKISNLTSGIIPDTWSISSRMSAWKT